MHRTPAPSTTKLNNETQYFAVMSLSTGKPLRVGCVGGGQLGRMMALEAPRIGIKMSFLDPAGTACPAAQVTPHELITQGSLKDPAAIHELVKGCDVVTVEIEHVCAETLALLEKEGVNVQPSARVISIIQDKYIQKVRAETILYFGSFHFACV
jgi:phosphoribosylaminoimidazole carboxylase (NCAIR synthetase)